MGEGAWGCRGLEREGGTYGESTRRSNPNPDPKAN